MSSRGVEGEFDEPGRPNHGTASSLLRKFSEEGERVSLCVSRVVSVNDLILDCKNYSRVRVDAAYKRKADKVHPAEVGYSDGSAPTWDVDWKKRRLAEEGKRGPSGPPGEFDHWLIPKFSSIPRGERLTEERVKDLVVGEGLWPRERELLVAMLYNREEAMAFDFTHCGRIHPDVAPPQEIRTLEHKAWQSPGFPVPKKLLPTVISMLQERVAAGTLEECHGPYRNQWFLVSKKSGKYRLVDAAMRYNAVTVRDANLPPNVDEISEEFAGCAITSLIDFFSGYDQITLAEKSRDLTGFMTPIGLLRHTSLVQGATNSVAQFVRVVNRILKDHIPERCRTFVDDVPVKGPMTTYNNEEAAPGIRRYVKEHIVDMDLVLADIERAGGTIGAKSQFCMPGIKLVGYVCGAEGRSPDSQKVIKILEWEACKDETAARSFLGVCVYYRIWIKNFSLIAEPIYRLLRKGVPFEWGQEQDDAANALKLALTSAPALVKLDYGDDAGKIILAVDASQKGWGAVLMQEDRDQRRHPCRYESGLWNDAESKYDATKRECRGVLKALKKVRSWLYGVFFILETDANVLVAQLNKSPSDLPGALVVRWLAWIRHFNFEVKHIPGTKHTAADGLSRRPRSASDDIDEAEEIDIDDFIDAELAPVRVFPIATSQADGEQQIQWLEGDYSQDSRLIAKYLSTLRRPEQVDKEDFRGFKSRALRYVVLDKILYKRGRRGAPPTRVLDTEKEKRGVIAALHDELGHGGANATYRRVADRYFWDGCHQDVKTYVRECSRCQFRSSTRLEEPLHPTWTTYLWQKVGLDVVYMPSVEGKKYLVVARDDLSGWVEARALSSATSAAVARFLWEDVICRYGMFAKLVVDGGPENKADVKALAEKYGIRRVVVSAYHPPANGMIERGHRPITDALAKMTDGGLGPWTRNLHSVLLADRSTVKSTTGKSGFSLIYGSEAILPVEFDVPVWRILAWDEATTLPQTLALRAQQIQRRDSDLVKAAARLKKRRVDAKTAFDNSHRTRSKPINEGDVVLLHDALQEVDMSARKKLGYRWLGPFRVLRSVQDKGTFELSEMHGAKLDGTFAGNRLKAFHMREGIFMSEQDDDHAENGTRENVGETVQPPILNLEPSDDPDLGELNSESDSEPDTELPRLRAEEMQRKERLLGRETEMRRQEQRREQLRRQELIPEGRKFAVVIDGATRQ